MARNVSPNGHGFGWRPQLPDQRDLTYSSPAHVSVDLPEFLDLRKEMPPVYDQGKLGSCVANAVGAALQHERMKHNLPEGKRVPSRLAIYYGARSIEGSIQSDSGSEIRDAIKYIAKTSVPFEDGDGGWPYDITKYRNKPPVGVFKDDKSIEYLSIPQSLQQLRSCLAEGWPVAFGFQVYSGLDAPSAAKNDLSDPMSGRLIMPKSNEAPLGGHAVMLVGYDNPNQVFLVRNSWSAAWGLRGYFIMPYSYVLRADLASDFWTIRFQ